MIVITGASDGLGLQLAKLYQSEGTKVLNLSRRESAYAERNVSVDLSVGSEVVRVAKEIAEIDEPLEAIINCAGILSIQPLGKITEDEASRVLSINVEAAVLLVSGLIDRIKRDGTDIVNVSSTVDLKGYVDQAMYGASKWAMRGFSVNLQAELKKTSSRVISFCTGGFETGLFEKASGEKQTFAPGEWMKAEDVAAFMKQILDLPKSMEISEVVINRKALKA